MGTRRRDWQAAFAPIGAFGPSSHPPARCRGRSQGVNVTAEADPPRSPRRADPAAPGSDRMSPLAVGVVVWLASEVMFFGGLFAAWFVLKAHNEPDWPPHGEEIDALRMLVFTIVLVSSSVTMHFAVQAAERRRKVTSLRWLAATIALGAAFLVNEVLEWAGLPFGFSSSAFSTNFYLLTGFHGAHVLGGLILMTVVGWVVFSPASKASLGESMRITGYYWHFVDVVWVLLFLTVYVLQ
jgi:cytochrome c oxidase subunit 3